MSTYEIIFSPTGGVKKVADEVAYGLAGSDVTVIDLTEIKDFSQYTFGEDDICVVAVPVYSGRMPALASERLQQMKGNGARVVMIAVFGNRAFDDTLIEMKDILWEAEFIPVAAVSAVAEHSISRRFAHHRPDCYDLPELAKFTRQIKEKLDAGIIDEDLEVPGNRPYKEAGKGPVPELLGRCVNCGYCAAKCPAGAISKEDVSVVDADKCIGCMRCTEICPQKARRLKPATAKLMDIKLEKVCAQRKLNRLFL